MTDPSVNPGAPEPSPAEAAPAPVRPASGAGQQPGRTGKTANQRPAPPPAPAEQPPAFDLLRHLLLGEEQQQLQQLRHRLDDAGQHSAEVSRVLPRAIQLRNKSGDGQLSVALTPTVEDAIEASARNNPQKLSDALYPVIGPAIRAAVTHTLSSMMQSLNETLNRSFSTQGLKWRLEALQTGKQFSEIVLLHTLLYRVEQVFLIHNETGLLLLDATAPAVATQDAHMVSGMLTAIQDFARDSFSAGQEETLETLDLGTLNVWIERGPRATLAAVIRGEAPETLRTVFREALEKIHLDHGADLAEFNGNAALFEISRPVLEQCLQSQLAAATSAGPAKKKLNPALVAIPLILALVAGAWMFFRWRENSRREVLVNALRNEPGFVVVEAREADGTFQISGLRDPLAGARAEQLLEASSLNPADVHMRWEPWQAAPFTAQRARQLLRPPAGVELTFDKGVLTASGLATVAWYAEARRLAPFLPGVGEFRAGAGIHTRLRDELAAQALVFPPGSAVVSAAHAPALDQIAAIINDVAAASTASLQVTITGSADPSGSPQTNLRLREMRAANVMQALISRGVPAALLRASVHAPDRDQATRSVSFRLTAPAETNTTTGPAQ
ncbi:MAG: OmpA family protein [Blastocatellia bacterium]